MVFSVQNDDSSAFGRIEDAKKILLNNVNSIVALIFRVFDTIRYAAFVLVPVSFSSCVCLAARLSAAFVCLTERISKSLCIF